MKCIYCARDRDTPGGCCYEAWAEATDARFASVFPWVLGFGVLAFGFFLIVVLTRF